MVSTDARRFDLVRRAGEQEQEEPKAPFASGDWVKTPATVTASGRSRTTSAVITCTPTRTATTTEFFRGAFEVEFVDGEPMRLACVWVPNWRSWR